MINEDFVISVLLIDFDLFTTGGEEGKPTPAVSKKKTLREGSIIQFSLSLSILLLDNKSVKPSTSS